MSRKARNLRLKVSLRDTIHLKLDEQLVMFLHTLGHNLNNRKIAHNFGHSKEIVNQYFHNILIAIKRTHIPVWFNVDIQGKYCDRKGNLSQNVMGVCSFDCKFQYCLAGWEGSAADRCILALALSRSNQLVVPPGKPNQILIYSRVC